MKARQGRGYYGLERPRSEDQDHTAEHPARTWKVGNRVMVLLRADREGAQAWADVIRAETENSWLCGITFEGKPPVLLVVEAEHIMRVNREWSLDQLAPEGQAHHEPTGLKVAWKPVSQHNYSYQSLNLDRHIIQSSVKCYRGSWYGLEHNVMRLMSDLATLQNRLEGYWVHYVFEKAA